MKRNQNVIENQIVTLGLDIGFGTVKAVTLGQSVIFASVWGAAREIKFRTAEIAAKYPGDQITDEDGEWFVGNLALSQLRTASQRKLRGRTADEENLGNVYRVRLAKVAVGKLFPNLRNGDVVHAVIATGLPVDHMRSAGDLKTALIGQHHIKTDQTDFVLNVTDVFVMPQPYGTIYSQMINEDGTLNPCYNYWRTGVVDVGNYTIDVTVDNEGEYIDTLSGSLEGGVHLVQEWIANAYERDYNKKISYGDLEAVLRTGCFRIQGQQVNYQRELEEATKPLREATINVMSDLWQNAADIDVVFLSGGGAGMVYPILKNIYPQAQLVEDAQLANAQGYLRYALLQAAE
jgi:plasmid segregation protein ParM